MCIVTALKLPSPDSVVLMSTIHVRNRSTEEETREHCKELDYQIG